MRNTAAQFMTESVTLYNPTFTYDAYGQQIVASGVGSTSIAYIGAVSASDKELIGAMYRTGMKTSYIATLLLPFDTNVYDTTIIHHNLTDWRILWHTNDTGNAVQTYTKCIIARNVYGDEVEQ